MSCANDWKIPTPAQLQFLGPSQSGKSTKLKLLLEEDDRVFDRPFHQVIYISPAAEELCDSPFIREIRLICEKRKKKLAVSKRLPTVQEIKDLFREGHILLILDDVTCLERLEGLSEISSLHSHHNLISVIYLIQNPYEKTRKTDLTTINRNLTGRFVFYQLSDWNLLRVLNSRHFPDRPRFIEECLVKAKEKNQNYIFLNTHCFTPLPRRYTAYTALFQKEQKELGLKRPLFFDLG